MKVIEKEHQFNEVIQRIDECFVIPIFTDSNKHPLNNKLSLLYVEAEEDYMLCFDHSESLGLPMDCLEKLNSKKIYTHDKKQLNHIFRWNEVIDLTMWYYLNTNKTLEFNDIQTSTHSFFNRKFYKLKNLNKIVPIVKHYEYCKEVVSKMKRVLDLYEEPKGFKSYNSEVLTTLSDIETSGVRFDTNYKTLENRTHVSSNNLVFTQYNPYTSTGRPSNKYAGTNYSALNKADGSRKPYISRFENGMLVEMDYDAYHLRLIADIIGYDFPDGSVHEYLSKQYGVDYNESKKLSFTYLYGGIPKDIEASIPFFKDVKNYIGLLWQEYKKGFSLNSYIYNRQILHKNYSDMNPNKVFNYMIQLMETEYNIKMLGSLFNLIDNYKSRLVLYQYDSFLFDFNLDDGKEFLVKVKNTIEQNGKFPVKVAYGKNYNEMKDFTEKLYAK